VSDPPKTKTALHRGSLASLPFAVPIDDPKPMTPEQAALELSDRVRWSEWNTKKWRLFIRAGEGVVALDRISTHSGAESLFSGRGGWRIEKKITSTP